MHVDSSLGNGPIAEWRCIAVWYTQLNEEERATLQDIPWGTKGPWLERTKEWAAQRYAQEQEEDLTVT